MAKARDIPAGWIIVAVLILAVVLGTHRTRDDGGGRRVVLWGDSLAWEARGSFQDALEAAGVTSVLLHTYGGTAPCDWLSDIRKQSRSFHPAVAVLAFSGNQGTDCMKDRDVVSAYRRDVTSAVARLTRDGTQVLLVNAPPRLDQQVNSGGLTPLDEVWAQIAADQPDVTVVPAGAAVTTPDGRFTRTLPCRTGERCGANGRVTVRAPDGVHFCPVTVAPMVPCPVPSPGAVRYGQAMARAALAALGPAPTATSTTVP